MASAVTNGIPNGGASAKPIEVAFPLPRAQQTNIHLQLRNTGSSVMLFLTTSAPESSSSAPLGSFVYAMPNRISPAETLSTPLFTHSGTLDFTTRLAKVLARKLAKPVYVGNSISFASAGMGGTVEEEMEGFRRVVEVTVGLLDKERDKEGGT
ncbi:hypothetical protein BU26DRAFT_429672 [Trematosphaeria pertusa]|uniref:Proteasome assembly chaperone 3 n=1 Tax=Trematosphaeria pertusa TaxID=390896 RepID=A0A6A6IC92_9PLEO|nr:uncharacterized protein BU26DRAFT_429672 [Trematosphaeria pertusa]KAF2247170.1 hypothetical protein BU26DRAFT_429672 [Trematosphaeria pertusa]